MDAQLVTLIELQGLDTRIAGLEAEAARLPRQIEALQAALADARRTLDALKTRADATRKDLRAKEKDLEVTATKRTKADARLWEVKTNKEYSAVLLEIEDIKQEKGRTEEEILALMEVQEALAADMRAAEARLQARAEEVGRDEAVLRQKLAEVEAELAVVRAERAREARELPPGLLAGYDRILRARGGLAVTSVTTSAICGGCRMTIRPQALLELRQAGSLINCESCGRFLYWQES